MTSERGASLAATSSGLGMAMEQQPLPLWYDPKVFEGVLAFSFALPYKLPLATGSNPIEIDNDYLRLHGASPENFDAAWMQTPFICLTCWFEKSLDPDPLVADTLLASTVLSALTGQQPPPEPLASDAASDDRSVAIVMVPVKSRDAALTPPHDDKVDPLTVAHWLIADIVRSLRITTQAPLPELHYPTLNPIVLATFGSGPTFDTLRFEERQYAILLDHLANPLTGVEPTDQATAGQVFGQLTRGSISALIRDHISRAHAERVSGDGTSADSSRPHAVQPGERRERGKEIGELRKKGMGLTGDGGVHDVLPFLWVIGSIPASGHLPDADGRDRSPGLAGPLVGAAVEMVLTRSRRLPSVISWGIR